MKKLIDIPEKIEEYIKDYIPIGAGNNVFCYPDEIVKVLQNGTPIPDNATVEDVINIVTNKALPIKADDCGIFMSIPTTWLKRPYQKGGTNEKQV